MKRYFVLVFVLFSFFSIVLSVKYVRASLPLSGKLIIIDPGHGGLDVGTSYKNIYEKDINLNISKKIEQTLMKYGASVVMTRTGDYDLSVPNTTRRKKSDFDNRIKLINQSKADLYLSIHQNYLNDFSYSGAQVFYNNDNLKLAFSIQDVMNKKLNANRKIKSIPTDTYMYSKLQISGVLIECGFISNSDERLKLLDDNYQNEIALAITEGLLKYFS